MERLVEDWWKERAKVRERKRDRGIEGETVHLMKIQRNV